MIEEKTLKLVRIEFNGKAGEYFRIWVVNILLTVLTLGIYSAWAKVRNKQYFYGNTLLDGTGFEYTASPLAILKGRLVVVALLAVYYLATHFFTGSQIVFFIMFFAALPWLIMRGLMFNARYSSYRNLCFCFQKNLIDSVKTFAGLLLLIPLTFGLIYPFYMHAVQQYRINNHSFGQYAFQLKNIVKTFYRFYAVGLLIMIVGAVIISPLIIIVIMIIPVIGIGMTLLTGFVYAYVSPHVFTVPLFIAYFILYHFAYAYIQTHTFNSVWSSTCLGKASEHSSSALNAPLMSFKGRLETVPMFKIYVTNTLAIIVSAGLLIPWAKVRLARYRIEHLDVMSIADLTAITAVQRDQVGPLGSEMGDIMDVEIGF